MSVGIVGGGPWGIALARAVARTGTEVSIMTRREAKEGRLIRVTSEFSEIARHRLLVIAVPSSVIVEVARGLGDHLDGGHMLVHGIRGLAPAALAPNDTLMTISDVLRQETPVRKVGALGGPIQADELHHGTASALVVGSRYPEVNAAVTKAFSGAWLRVYPTQDVRGLELASAMIGCVAMGVGFAKEGGAGPGLLAALISRAVHDAGRLAAHAGALETTLYGLGGYGDLLASIGLDKRPEVIVGRALAQGKSLEAAMAEATLRVEAIELLPRLVAFAKSHGVRAPAFEGLARMLEGRRADEILHQFFTD